MKYRLSLDLGTTSLGWAILMLNEEQPPRPKAIAKAGVRIFGTSEHGAGRHPKKGTSLAVERRLARSMRRRRDRLLLRKEKMMEALIGLGFFQTDTAAREAMLTVNPYELRAKGIQSALKPEEFARALFHINQRRGFQSNRKTDNPDADEGAMKSAISRVRDEIKTLDLKTVGQLLWHRMQNGAKVRAKNNGLAGKKLLYELYIDRDMIKAEFDALWQKQAEFNRQLFNEEARDKLRDILTYQRDLKPVLPGRCTFETDQHRAPLALPSTQRYRIYQEVNSLKILSANLDPINLTLAQRDAVVAELERKAKVTFKGIKTLLGLSGTTQFNLEDVKREELKGNATSAALSKKDLFGDKWCQFDEQLQSTIVEQLLNEESTQKLVDWLREFGTVDLDRAERIAQARLPQGYGSLSRLALSKILPELRREVIHYAEAAKRAGYHHSKIIFSSEVPGKTVAIERVMPSTGEIRIFHTFEKLPYYGEYLTRHVGFADVKATASDLPEKRFGRIANPTVHIGLNQVREVVNALIERYGHPEEVVVEVARELKQSRDQKRLMQETQAANQALNDEIRSEVAQIRGCSRDDVTRADLQKWKLWVELNPKDVMDRKCPFSGVQIGKQLLFGSHSDIEIEHLLPFALTLDDSMGNKTVCTREANRIKRKRTPYEAKADFEKRGWSYEEILQRARYMSAKKRSRFAADGYENWLKNDAGFLARALNDTGHLSRVASEYLSLICPQATWVIPGQLTGMLRHQMGLNKILGLTGEKNRNDHRHHAVDACVIGITDRGMLKAFADANQGQTNRPDRTIQRAPRPWETYRDHVARAIGKIVVSHRPDHGHQGAMHEDSAWGFAPDGDAIRRTRGEDGLRHREKRARTLIPIAGRDPLPNRHGLDQLGNPKAYKGYVGGSNFCMDIVCNEKGKWESEVVSTFEAYQLVRKMEGLHGAVVGYKMAIQRLQSKTHSISGKSLVMRLQSGDTVRMMVDEKLKLMRVVKMTANGQVFFAEHHEANVDKRNTDKAEAFAYTSKLAGSLQKAQGRKVMVSRIGEVRDPGLEA